jgi:hypothetical protein
MGASRIANVSAAVLATGASRTASPGPLLAQLFEDTLWVGDVLPAALAARHVPRPGPSGVGVAGLSAAIVAAEGERVIVVGEGDPLASAELLLALVAWPEAAIVLPAFEASGDARGRGGVPIGIYRREDLRARAEAMLASGASDSDFEAFVAGLEVVRVPVARFGLSDAPIPLFAGRAPGPPGATRARG